MQKSKKQPSPKTQATAEPFADVAARAGAALADLIEHEDCPATIADMVAELDTAVFNRFPDVAISLRHSFPKRLVGALEQSA